MSVRRLPLRPGAALTVIDVSGWTGAKKPPFAVGTTVTFERFVGDSVKLQGVHGLFKPRRFEVACG
ncbi:hypothetical protein [Phenylobacterium sp.]|uniref:hypothetical protein n=1 Tax=Phenylobacterium sp. TaxID=1871053 RepID=UPI0025DA9B3D|nr:hypothetical protein [Phenylobacterium sp.]MBX3482517.1 hypothetical protein [Phenylobacterium sp.]MCW5758264.1 hypothetical protein [Phenylobacterium sp.]